MVGADVVELVEVKVTLPSVGKIALAGDVNTTAEDVISETEVDDVSGAVAVLDARALVVAVVVVESVVGVVAK